MKYLYFSANWCGPCKTLGPIMERVKNYKINVQKIDVDTNSDLTSQFGIRNIPTVVLVNEMGEEHTRITGVQSVEKYVSVYESFDTQK
jgi:thioredoxin 1